MPKKALITGITGQDGSYLTEFLIQKGYEVHGIIRRSSSINTWRLDHLIKDEKIYGRFLFLHYGDVSDSTSLKQIINKLKPAEIYNLAAQSHVKISFEIPEITANTDAIGTLKLLETIRNLDLVEQTKLYQASTSELYGKVVEIPQTETTPFYPRSPYGVAKLYGYWIIKNYREAYNLFACNGILFNHESERRGFNFVSRKITIGLAKIKLGYDKVLQMGNLNAKRDWGYAPEYVECMWSMLQCERPEDYVIATGQTHTVRSFIELSAAILGFEIEWEGEGLDEVGIDKKTGKTIVKVNPNYFRPTEVDLLLGDPSKAKRELGWQPQTTFEQLVKIMTEADYKLLKENKGRFLY